MRALGDVLIIAMLSLCALRAAVDMYKFSKRDQGE